MFLLIISCFKLYYYRDYKPKGAVSIHLLGEQHANSEIKSKELEIWKSYYDQGLRVLFIEAPYYEAQFLNLYMKSSNSDILYEIYADLEGTQAHNPDFLLFYEAVKENCPETVFFGTDVGHQYFSMGARYLDYLEKNGLKDSDDYKLAAKNIEQGKKYQENYSEIYREKMMVENFIEAYELANTPEIAGIYGANHVSMAIKGTMAEQLRTYYGDVIEGDCLLNLFQKLTAQLMYMFNFE